ncbi:beta-lactamase domain-containing protein 2-like [Rosa sericea]
MANDHWIYDTPPLSDVEAKLRPLLVQLGNDNKLLGVQVCAYKDGKVIIDTAGGLLEKDSDRPVQPDSLFPVFSVTKGITAGMLHWLIDAGKLKLEDSVANIWSEFGSHGKDLIKVHHALNHTSGLHNALADIVLGNPFLMSNWEECLKSTAMSVPESEPGKEQTYHYISYGYICGGIIEHASGKKFQEILEEAFIHPLQIEGELYIGIPAGVEARLASLAPYGDDPKKLSEVGSRLDLPSSLKPDNIQQAATMVPALFNMLNIRRAIIPAANAHCSARAIARYYASLVDGGAIPPPHSSSSSTPPLGSHPHIPHSTAAENSSSSPKIDKLFSNPKIHDAFLGVGEYASLVKQDGIFGLGFKRCHHSKDRSLIGFGHSGMGGSTGFCDIENKFAIAVTLNKMSYGAETARIIQLVCSELNIPVPEEYSGFEDSDAKVLVN